jgi:hypothetical protein
MALQWVSLLGVGYVAREGDVAWRVFLPVCGAVGLVGVVAAMVLYVISTRVNRQSFWPVAVGIAPVFAAIPLAWWFVGEATVERRVALLLCLVGVMAGPAWVADELRPSPG